MTTDMKRKSVIKAGTNVFVGKDVIELVGNAMYLDPLTIYREYIQNSVDAIDEAISAGLLSESSDGRIDIVVDAVNRNITIRDNGIGIPHAHFLNRMLAIGGSLKRNTSARGFRGVGRLAGLGFCQKLSFRSRAPGGKVCQLSWDVRKMKTALAEFGGEGDIAELITKVTTSEFLDGSKFPDHFFEVEIANPLRLSQDSLLNFAKIRDYVGQIAPVPFSPTFSHACNIRETLKDTICFREYPIFLNDDVGQIFKPYENEIQYSETKRGQLHEVEFFNISSLDGENGAIGWLVHHDYQGAIPKSAGVGGLRARVGNLQIGERNVFIDAFPEDRFNSWSVGEVHIFDKRVVPNGRRDGFEHGNHLSNLKSQLLPIGHKVAQQCRKESSHRNQSKRVEFALFQAETLADVLKQNALSKGVAKAKTIEAKGKIADARNAYDPETFKATNGLDVLEKIASLEKRLSNGNDTKNGNDPLGHLPNGKRTAYAEVFELIYACSSNEKNAKNLIDSILKRL